MQHRPERDVPQVRRGAVIPYHAVREHRERVRFGAAKDARPLDADGAPTVGVVDKREFSPVSMGFLDRRKLAGLRTENNRRKFLGLCSRYFVGGKGANNQQP